MTHETCVPEAAAMRLPPGALGIGILSGKGGVGKSVVSALLATAMAEAGHAVGLLDADITGPSIPRMFGLHERPETCGGQLIPVRTRRFHLPVMSINLLIEQDDDPVIWRGPRMASAVTQFVSDVSWEGIEYLLVDLPPGTSDIPLTIMQQLPLAGVVVVATPQELTGMIVRKAIRMAALMEVRVLGLVQNMVYTVCPECGHRVDLFGNQHASPTAETFGVPLLAELPLDPVLTALCDSGEVESYQPNPLAGVVETVLAAVARGGV